jgi:hypothetical protein
MRPKRFQYRPLSKPITLLHSAWWELGPLEFSVWHTPNAKKPNDERFTFRVRLVIGERVWSFDWKRVA